MRDPQLIREAPDIWAGAEAESWHDAGRRQVRIPIQMQKSEAAPPRPFFDCSTSDSRTGSRPPFARACGAGAPQSCHPGCSDHACMIAKTRDPGATHEMSAHAALGPGSPLRYGRDDSCRLKLAPCGRLAPWRVARRKQRACRTRHQESNAARWNSLSADATCSSIACEICAGSTKFCPSR